MSIPTLEQALDHAHLVGGCVSTSAKALKRLAEEIADLQARNEQMVEENQWYAEKVDELLDDIQNLKTELSEVSRGLSYYERGDWE